MDIYNLPKLPNIKKSIIRLARKSFSLKRPQSSFVREKLLRSPNRKKSVSIWRGLIPGIMLTSFLSSLLGFFLGFILVSGFPSCETSLLDIIPPILVSSSEAPSLALEQTKTLTQEEAVIAVIEKASPSVVSIVVTKDLPIVEQYYYNPFQELEDFFGEDFGIQVPQYREKGTEKKEIGGGTGFIVSKDGLILTNKHVVLDTTADYTVLTNTGKKYEAEVLARDPMQDIAILKIKVNFLPVVKLGDSDELKMGQTVIAIGNVLGEFRNSVSLGIISGLSRNVIASGGGFSEALEGIIQTDAAINPGNSGGPLLNIHGEVIGINTAMAIDAENVGFAIPINKAKRDIAQVKKIGEIVYPFLGIYYTMITSELAEEHSLSVDYGAWVGRNQLGEKTKEPIFSDSPAEKADLRTDDIILEFGGKKLTTEKPLADIIMEYSPGNNVELKILRNGEELTLIITLSRYPD